MCLIEDQSWIDCIDITSRWDTFVLFHLYGNKGVSLPLWPIRPRWFHTYSPCAEPLGDGHEGMWARFGSQGLIALNWHSRYRGTFYSGTWLYLVIVIIIFCNTVVMYTVRGQKIIPHDNLHIGNAALLWLFSPCCDDFSATDKSAWSCFHNFHISGFRYIRASESPIHRITCCTYGVFYGGNTILVCNVRLVNQMHISGMHLTYYIVNIT